jgi:hypothetical protein
VSTLHTKPKGNAPSIFRSATCRQIDTASKLWVLFVHCCNTYQANITRQRRCNKPVPATWRLWKAWHLHDCVTGSQPLCWLALVVPLQIGIQPGCVTSKLAPSPGAKAAINSLTSAVGIQWRLPQAPHVFIRYQVLPECIDDSHIRHVLKLLSVL